MVGGLDLNQITGSSCTSLPWTWSVNGVATRCCPIAVRTDDQPASRLRCAPPKSGHLVAFRAQVARTLPAIASPAHRGDRPPRFSSARTLSCQGHWPVCRAVLLRSPRLLAAAPRPTPSDTRFPFVTPAPALR